MKTWQDFKCLYLGSSHFSSQMGHPSRHCISVLHDPAMVPPSPRTPHEEPLIRMLLIRYEAVPCMMLHLSQLMLREAYTYTMTLPFGIHLCPQGSWFPSFEALILLFVKVLIPFFLEEDKSCPSHSLFSRCLVTVILYHSTPWHSRPGATRWSAYLYCIPTLRCGGLKPLSLSGTRLLCKRTFDALPRTYALAGRRRPSPSLRLGTRVVIYRDVLEIVAWCAQKTGHITD